MIGVVAVVIATLFVALAILAPANAALQARSIVSTLRLRRRAARARRIGEASLVPALEAVLAASRAGLPLRDALGVARERARGELAERITAAVTNEALGQPLADALADARRGARGSLDALLGDLELCARARLHSERIAAFVEDQLGTHRFARELASDLAARTAGQRFQVWVLAAIVPALALYLAAMSPTLSEELRSPIGRYVFVPGGLLFEIAGIYLSRRVVERACR